MSTNKRVGLVFLSEDGGKLTAHLEKRQEKVASGGTDIKWPGIYLATVGGKLTEDENELTALSRQLIKKFGTFKASWIINHLVNSGPEKQILFKDKQITVYGFIVQKEVLASMHPRILSDDFSHVTVENMSDLITVQESWKHQPHNTRGIVVFPHLQEALKRAFSQLGKR